MGETLYWVAGFASLIGMGLGFVGTFYRLAWLGRRRLVGLALLLVSFFGGGGLIGLLEPESVRADAARRRTESRREPVPPAAAFITLQPRFTNEYGVISISGRLQNSGPTPLGEIQLRCETSGETGGSLNTWRITVHRRVPANSTVRFGPLRLGIAEQQATSVACDVIHAQRLPQP